MSIELRAAPTPQAAGPGRAQYPIVHVLLLLLLLAGVGVLLVRGERTYSNLSSSISARAAEVRQVASKLKAAGANEQAAMLYADYLNADGILPSDHAAIAFSLGELQLERGRFQAALRWYYEAQMQLERISGNDRASLKEEVNRKVVYTLERMGKSHAAREALKASVALGAGQSSRSHGVADPIVAQVGAKTVYRSDIQRAYDELPDAMKQQSGEGMTGFAKQYVAELLMRRKAEKLGYDRDPEVLRQLNDVMRRLMVSKFVQEEVVAKQELNEADVATYFTANRARYDTPPALKLSVAQVKTEAIADTLMHARGVDFTALVKKHSVLASKEQGGRLPVWITPGQTIVDGLSAIDLTRIFSALKGAVLKAKSAGMWVVVRVDDRREPKPASLQEATMAKRVQRDYLHYKTQMAYMKMVDSELRSPDVKLHLDVLGEE